MAEEEKDPERLQRVRTVVHALGLALSNHTVADAQTALANAICKLCVAVHPEDPDHVFLNTMGAINEVWILYRAQLQQSPSPDAVPDILN